MKSIVQEASTIAKAIEKGWKQAGEPQEFSIKVLELPEHNFIGLTTRSAKIAIMFSGPLTKSTNERNQKPYSHPRPPQQKTQRDPQQKRTERTPQQERPPRPTQTVERNQASQQPKQNVTATKPVQPARPSLATPVENQKEVSDTKTPRRRAEGLWSPELTTFAQGWFEKVLKHMGRDIKFTIEPQNFYLRITLDKPILPDEAKEKHLLASLSSLMLATVKKEFRKALRGHKIVLTHAQ